MPSQPPPGSTGGSPRNPAPFQPAPESNGGNPRTPAPFQLAPGSSGGSAWTPAAPSAQAADRGSEKSIVLTDWCMEKVEGEEGKIRVCGPTWTAAMTKLLRETGSSQGKGDKIMTRRDFISTPIVKRLGYQKVESEDGYRIWLHKTLNIPKTRENGFSQEVIAMIGLEGLEFWKVCESFEFGFPIPWQSLVNPKMAAPSETTTSAPSHSLKCYEAWFLSERFSSSFGDDLSVLPSECICKTEEGPSSGPRKRGHKQKEIHNEAPVIPKSGKDSVILGSTDALELQTEGMTPKFGATGSSEDSTGRRLRSGKVLGMPSGSPKKGGSKQKEIHQEASSKQMVHQEATSTSTADLTSNENGFSTALVVFEEKRESHDSRRKGRERPPKRNGRK